MIYLDNSATTYPKPPEVIYAVNRAMREYSFNPGRGGYRKSILTSEKAYEARSTANDFFGAAGEENVIFTSGCTEALNIVIKGVLRNGDHIVISSFEHNAVARPLEKLRKNGLISYSVADVILGDDDATLNNFRNSVNSKTRMIICTHASNAFGVRLPVERICALAHSYNILFCLDAAQSAGIFDINIERDGYDFVCCAGHKYLYGPMGTGMLIIRNGVRVDTLIEGGTGSESSDLNMPSYYPDRLEAGTVNISGIMGLNAGMRFVRKRGIDSIYHKDSRLIQRLADNLKKSDRIKVYGDCSRPGRFAPVLSFTVEGADSETVARYLSKKSNISVRSGLHCAPLAHRYMGTLESGTVRISPSVFTTEQELNILVNSLRKFR